MVDQSYQLGDLSGSHPSDMVPRDLESQEDPPPFHEALPLSILFGVFMAYGVPWMVRLCPSQVRITEKFLVLMRGNQQRMVMWNEVRAHRFDRLEDVDVLQLALQNGSALAIGLDESVQAEEFGRFLEGVGVPRNEDA